MNKIVTATAYSDGSPRECPTCCKDIAVGGPAALNQHGVEYHRECINLTSRQAHATPRKTLLDAAADIYCGPESRTPPVTSSGKSVLDAAADAYCGPEESGQ